MVKARSRINSRGRLAVVVFIVIAALAFLMIKSLGDASVYFKTADEAVAQRDELGDRRFRIEGTVVSDSVKERAGGVSFEIENKGVKVEVNHKGDPPELFRETIPVVLEGRFSGKAFASDRIMVKHSETYVEQNPDRFATTTTNAQSR